MSTVTNKIDEKGICLLTFNRPDKYNSFNKEFLDDLHNTLHSLKHNKSVRIIILTGAGNKAFSSGADLKALQEFSSIEEAKEFALLLEETSEQLFNFPTPIISAINGYALGGGMGYAAATDYRIMADNAKAGFPAIKLGAILPVTCTLYLKELIGMSHSKDLLLSGRLINATEAKAMGLVQQVVKPNHLMEEAYKLAETIIEGSIDAVFYTKKTLNSLLAENIESRKLYAANNFAYLSQTQEWKKRIQSFGKK